MDTYLRVTDLVADDAESRVWVGRILMETGRPAEAAPFWRSVLELDPDDRRAAYFLDLAQDQAEWGTRAVDTFRDGVALYEQGQATAAGERFARAAVLNPAYPEAWAWLGRVAFEAGAYAEARRAYANASGLEPRNETYAYFLARSRLHESVALLLVAFTLFVPNVWLDMVQPRFDRIAPAALEEAVAAADPGDRLRLVVSGHDLATGVDTATTVVLDIAEGEAADRIGATGLMLLPDGEDVALEEPMFGSPMADTLSGFDFYGAEPVQLVAVEAPADRLPAQLFYIPALLLLGLVIAMQRRRQTQPAF